MPLYPLINYVATNTNKEDYDGYVLLTIRTENPDVTRAGVGRPKQPERIEDMVFNHVVVTQCVGYMPCEGYGSCRSW